MYDKLFKQEPVSAFFKLLIRTLPHLLITSGVMTVIGFFAVKLVLVKGVGESAISELQVIMEDQQANPSDFEGNARAMEDFLKDYPSVIPAMFVVLILGILITAYLLNSNQLFIKKRLLESGNTWRDTLMPDGNFFRIVLFLVLAIGTLLVVSGFLALAFSIHVLAGVAAIFIVGMWYARFSLVIPAMVIGNMTFGESVRYSVTTLTGGRGVKIMIFGMVFILILSVALSLILYFPSMAMKAFYPSIFLNFFAAALQTTWVGSGMASLFLRYADFEEVNVTE